MTQKELITKYINDFGSITPFQAFSDLGITKLATRVSEMKQDGVLFDTVLVPHTTRYGKKTHFAKYSWRKDKKNEG